MSVDALLTKLDRVRRTGDRRWIARCPAHDDKGPSLSVRELGDGRTLVHCFAGCGVEEVLGAVGLSFCDLYPEQRTGDHVPRERRPYSVRDLVRALRFELTVALVLLADVKAGKPLGDAERVRAGIAADRIQHFLAELDHAG